MRLHQGKVVGNEQGVLHAILSYLRLRGIPHAHVRNTGRIIRRGDGAMVWGKSQWSQPGVADILAVWRGWALAIEVKSETGKVRPEQQEWLSAWRQAGGHSVVARRVEDVEDFLRGLG